ncbi:MAG: hypothetical protein AMJ75_00525 [Phycisphaerae bacterium SM1_79]|nr:MAG: hypothetical protein AMJ75_00525 [Phycisphaerae bacterium SM1_79]
MSEKKAKIARGYYIKARKIEDSEVAHKPPHIREIWDWLIRNANHTDRKCGDSVIRRGQLLTSYREIRGGLHWKVGWRKMTYSKWQCENALKLLKKATMIATQKTARGIIITVLNYDFYQNPKNYECHKKTNTRATREPQTTDTTNNELNELKEQKKKSPLLQVFDHWNLYRGQSTVKGGKTITWHSHRLRPDGSIAPDIEKAIEQTLKGKHSLDEICVAIDNYARALLGNDYFWTHVWALSTFLTVGEERHKQAPRKFYRFLPDNFVEGNYLTNTAEKKRAVQARGPSVYELAKQQSQKTRSQPDESQQTA